MISTEFETAFDELHRVAYTVAYKILNDRDESQDVAQESLARAFASWKKVRDYAGPWVAKTAGHLAIDRWRRLKRPLPASSLASLYRPADDEAAMRVTIREALVRLPKRQREVLVLRYLTDLTEESTARALGVKVGTVKQHNARALAALRTRLGGDA